jgi:hypothetical protein
MGKPAFIYAFDNLEPHRFVELCGELLGSRYKGFGFYVLGGVGPDGGVDAELDTNLGIWQPESEDALLNDIIRPGKTVVFQFKHKVVARAGGQAKARAQLLRLYKCRESYTCELHRHLVVQKNPSDYVLVTNVEVSSNFREKFMKVCQVENPDIEHYQVIGLDELEAWITMEPELRHLYLPTIFGPPRFALQIQLSEGYIDFFSDGRGRLTWGRLRSETPSDSVKSMDLFQVSVLNIGTAPSYIASIAFKLIVDGKFDWFFWENYFQAAPEIKSLNNPDFGTALEPGRKHLFSFPFDLLSGLKQRGREVFPDEVLVYDEIGNIYSAAISENLRNKLIG